MFSLRSHVSYFFIDFLPPPSTCSYGTSRPCLPCLFRGLEVRSRFDQSAWESYLGNFMEINSDHVTAGVPVRQAKYRKTREECGEATKHEIFSGGRKLNVQCLYLWFKIKPLYSKILTTLQASVSDKLSNILKQRINHCPIAVVRLSSNQLINKTLCNLNSEIYA